MRLVIVMVTVAIKEMMKILLIMKTVVTVMYEVSLVEVRA